MRPRLAFPLLLVTALLGAHPARAQDGEPPARAQDPAPAVDADLAASLLEKLRDLYPRAAERPAPFDHTIPQGSERWTEERQRFTRAEEAWKAALERLPTLSEEYRDAAGEGAAPVAWYYAGFARVRRADAVSRSEGRDLLQAGVSNLREFLERTAQDAPFRDDAQALLAYGMVRLAGGEEAGILAAGEHADPAVRRLLANGRGEEAGRLAALMLKSLVAVDRESEAAALAAGWQADVADFGPSTDAVRRLVRRSGVRPGAPLPALPELASCTGAPMPWKELAGKPYVLHFFSTVVSATPREIETILVPLRDRWGDAGLRLVGCSTDREMDDAELERTRKNWEEWGKTEPLRDGRKASVREWAEACGLDWPFYWDGRWTSNALVQHLGIEVGGPFAILVDGNGVIRWRGKPFEGLPEAVEQLMGAR